MENLNHETSNQETTFGFWNDQGCFLDAVQAKNIDAAKRKFKKDWVWNRSITVLEMNEE